MSFNKAIYKIGSLIEESLALFENEEKEDNWSKAVTEHEKFHPPEGTFSKNPQEIARIISQNKRASYQTAMSRLNFFLNRGGENISPDMRARVNKAKDILRKMYGKEKD